MPRDRRRLGRRVESAAALRDAAARDEAFGQVIAELEAAAARVEARRHAVPAVSYPPELPVSQRKDELAAAIRDNQVVIIAGETGSGKTTQLPKICLELGRGVTGQIGHTQPRRIAARTVAERIAEELGTAVGAAVGYKVRFTDTSSDDTFVKVMTDGILLAEMQQDRQLLRYDTLIIDEAHERSLNIDFILGYLKRLLPSRPDLKVIITSATIDPERFSKHFGGGESGEQGWDAPVIEVSGRTYPVEVRYRPLADPDRPGDEPKDQAQGICDAIGELRAEGSGDVLVFLSGEREIRDTADALAEQADPAGLEVLPLYGRLSAAEQHRVFEPHQRAAGGAGHQRRGDLADRAGHQVRDRPGHRADLPLQPPDQGAAAAYRADLPGLGEPAQGPVRADVQRHMHPAVQRGGLRLAAGVHRPGDPAHQPRVGHPAGGGARPRRCRGLPVRGSAGVPQHRRRCPAARGAGRDPPRQGRDPADRRGTQSWPGCR